MIDPEEVPKVAKPVEAPPTFNLVECHSLEEFLNTQGPEMPDEEWETFLASRPYQSLQRPTNPEK